MPETKVLKPCEPTCTRIVKFMTDQEIAPGMGISIPPYSEVIGYSYLNIFVRFNQEKSDEPPVDLGVTFAFDENGKLAARRYVNLEENVTSPQSTNFIEVSGRASWHGSPHNVSTYIARIPVMGPYVEVFAYNRAPVKRRVTVWGYLVS